MKPVVIQNLTVHLGRHPVLQDVSMEMGAGEVTGLIGPNGAGKSTLMKALVRLLRPSAGSIHLFGQDLAAMPLRELGRRVGYLPQGQEIHWPLAVEKVVTLGRIPHLLPWQALSTEDEAAIVLAMAETDVSHLAARPVQQLAGGEKTLVKLARVLAGEPALILADEPVAGLDPNHELQVMELLKGLAAEGHSVLVVLHNLTLAARFCDRLILLHAGRVTASGAPHEVLAPEKLKQAYRIEARYGNGEAPFVLPWRRI